MNEPIDKLMKFKTIIKTDIRDLIKSLFGKQDEILNKLDIIAKKENHVFIENAKDIAPTIPDEIKVSNFPEQKEVKFPEIQKVEVQEPKWWKFDYSKIIDPIARKFDEIRQSIKDSKSKAMGDTPQNPIYMIPVSPDNKNTPYTISGGRGGGPSRISLEDISGNTVTVTSNKLDVNASVSIGGIGAGSMPIGTVVLGAGGALVGTVSIQGTITASDNVYADTTPIVVGSSLSKPAAGVYQVTPTVIADGQMAIISIDAARRQIMTLGGAGTVVNIAGTPQVTGFVTLVGTSQITGFVSAVMTMGPLAVSTNPIGSVAILGIPQVTGFLSIAGIPQVTGFVAVDQLPVIALGISTNPIGSVAILGTPSITGFVGISGTPAFTGYAGISIIPPLAVSTNPIGSVALLGIPQVTGFITLVGNSAVTGFVGISGTPAVTGYVGISQISLDPATFYTCLLISATGSSIVKAAAANKRTYITSILISCSTNMNCDLTLNDTATTPIIQRMYFALQGGVAMPFPSNTPVRAGAGTNAAIIITNSVAQPMTITLTAFDIT